MINSVNADVAIRRRTIAPFLKNAREASGLTQRDVSRALSYTTPQFISNWERGLANPPLDALAKLAELYSLKADELIRVIERHEQQMLAHQMQILRERLK